MIEDEIRAIVRDELARYLAAAGRARVDTGVPAGADPRTHASHGLLGMAPEIQKGEPCIIEPHVACALCGFCQSLGH